MYRNQINGEAPTFFSLTDENYKCYRTKLFVS